MSFMPTRRQMRGYLVWATLLLVAGVAGTAFWLTRTPPTDQPLTDEEAATLDSFNRAVAADSVARREEWENRFTHYGKHNGTGRYKGRYGQKPAAETFPFDPNRCDSLTFLRLGLKPWQAHNALQYRRKGGVWRSVEHFSKLYGLDPDDYKRLAPYIRIDSAISARQEKRGGNQSNERTTTVASRKYEPGSVVLDLNACDTAELRRIPEIGAYRAQKIVEYRERLGGFVSVSQLQEIQGLPQGIETWFLVDEDAEPERLNANTATFQTLFRHPYVNYEQAREIMNYRRRYGRLESLDDLHLSPHFTPEDLRRLRPYLEF